MLVALSDACVWSILSMCGLWLEVVFLLRKQHVNCAVHHGNLRESLTNLLF